MSIQSFGITTQFATRCCVCGGHISAGAKAKWLKDVGTWHAECQDPPNARLYQREAEQRRALGLEPFEFGKAPMLKERE